MKKSAPKYKCVYCGLESYQPFDEEHVIPRSLGKFLIDGKEAIITDRICNECNSEISKCESELSYCGPEAMLRKMAGVKGRKRKKENPFYKNKRSPKPIDIVGQRDGLEYPQLWEIDPNTGHGAELNQIILKHPKTQEWITIRLTKDMTKKKLVDQIKEAGGNLKGNYFLSWDPDDVEWIERLLGDDFKRIQTINADNIPKYQKTQIHAVFQITDKHPRAIAKIAFTYMMYFRPCGVTGHEKAFEGVKRFIRYGKIHPETFVRYTNEPILQEAKAGFGLIDYGHIVTCGIEKNTTALVHLFTGRETGHGAYKVFLGKYPLSIIANESIGHWFRITSKPEDKNDSGEVIRLLIPKRIAILRPF